MDRESNLSWLQNWFFDHYDSDFDYAQEVKIEAIDNPGWHLQIDLEGTELEGKPFEAIQIDNGDDWLVCKVENDMYDACGDSFKLDEIIGVFRRWASENE